MFIFHTAILLSIINYNFKYSNIMDIQKIKINARCLANMLNRFYRTSLLHNFRRHTFLFYHFQGLVGGL